MDRAVGVTTWCAPACHVRDLRLTEQKAEQDFDSKSNGDQETEEIDMEKYLISESSDDESECDEDADEKNCQVPTKNWKKLNADELPDINRIQIDKNMFHGLV